MIHSSNETHTVLTLSRWCAGLVGISFSFYLSIEDGWSDNAKAAVFRSPGWSRQCDGRVGVGWCAGGVVCGWWMARHILFLLALILKAEGSSQPGEHRSCSVQWFQLSEITSLRPNDKTCIQCQHLFHWDYWGYTQKQRKGYSLLLDISVLTSW